VFSLIAEMRRTALSFPAANRHLAAMHAPLSSPRPPSHALGFREFVAMMAALMAMTALGIDAMLPALPAIGDDLRVADPNDRQWVIAAFMFGFGAGQLVHGPLADRFGRRPVLLVSLAVGVAFNLLAAFAATYPLLLAARVAAGLATASSRVVTTAIVRDRVSGDQMARTMSLIAIVFMVVPIAAPNLGQLILFVAPWRWVFGMLAAAGLLMALWASIRLPETLDPAHRLPLRFGRIAESFRFVLTNRVSLGYTGASALLQGGLMGFLLSVQQILEVEFRAAHLFGLIFAAIALPMAAASFFNSRMVVRLGARAVSHRAIIGYVLIAAIHLGVAFAGLETLASFALLQAAMMCCFSLAGANFSAIAMEPMGRVAGTASSAQAFIQTIVGTALGAAIGQAFDGTTVPLYLGFTLCGLGAVACVAAAERGRLFARA
jgi:DHA1 family bicyclomycin/chloramphenicol resistance-like MFS transporter